MASEKPSAWARGRARSVLDSVVSIRAAHVYPEGAAPSQIEVIATALDDARREREAEIVEWLRQRGLSTTGVMTVNLCADEIERGAGRKESV